MFWLKITTHPISGFAVNKPMMLQFLSAAEFEQPTLIATYCSSSISCPLHSQHVTGSKMEAEAKKSGSWKLGAALLRYHPARGDELLLILFFVS